MKVKALSRNEQDYVGRNRHEMNRTVHNYDPNAHHFQREREYTRAVNAVKLERLFAKPFVFQLDGHTDTVNCLERHRNRVGLLMSGSANGEFKIWNLGARKPFQSTTAHSSTLTGMGVMSDNSLITCSSDGSAKHWKVDTKNELNETELIYDFSKPMTTFLSKSGFNKLDTHYSKDAFVTGSNVIQLWNVNRTEAISEYSWGCQSIYTVRFNPSEKDICASAGSDRSIILYDIRTNSPIRKVVLKMTTNAIAWNPMEPFYFTAANEDHNLYTFDMRNLKKINNIHKDHQGAVMDVSYSPTGQEFCSASYDKTIRIFKSREGHSREVYHTRRMQRVFSACFSGDAKYVMSGSDDTNIRIWKADASQKLGPTTSKERAKIDYNKKLITKFKNVKDVQRISKHRHVPKYIKAAKDLKATMRQSERRKEGNREKFTYKKGEYQKEKTRQSAIVTVEK